MRYRSLILVAPFAAALMAAATPGSLHAQGSIRAQVTVSLRAVVPSVVKYIVDESIRTPDGAPLVRVVTNDPAIRRQQAVAIRSESVLPGVNSESSSNHAKGAERMPAATGDRQVVFYSAVTP